MKCISVRKGRPVYDSETGENLGYRCVCDSFGDNSIQTPSFREMCNEKGFVRTVAGTAFIDGKQRAINANGGNRMNIFEHGEDYDTGIDGVIGELKREYLKDTGIAGLIGSGVGVVSSYVNSDKVGDWGKFAIMKRLLPFFGGAGLAVVLANRSLSLASGMFGGGAAVTSMLLADKYLVKKNVAQTNESEVTTETAVDEPTSDQEGIRGVIGNGVRGLLSAGSGNIAAYGEPDQFSDDLENIADYGEPDQYSDEIEDIADYVVSDDDWLND